MPCINAQDLTNEAFLTQIPAALRKLGVSRLYRTGDLGRLCDGDLQFAGRKGHGQAQTDELSPIPRVCLSFRFDMVQIIFFDLCKSNFA